MLNIALMTFKHTFKDRVALIILSMIILYLLVPVFASFSPRQAQEVSITMALTLNSFILLLLSLFGAVATIWRDIERKFVYTLLSYPIKRESYVIGRFLGFALVILLIGITNFLLSVVVIKFGASMYKSRLPILWENILLSFVFTYLKYILLMAFGFLFVSFSTSFFMTFFATVTVYISGNASQGVYDYVFHTSNKDYSALFKFLVKFIYYVLPNFTSFDFIAYAAYALKVNFNHLWYTLGYFILYFLVIFILTTIIFSKRDLV